MRTWMNKRCIRGQRGIYVGHMRRRIDIEQNTFSRILGLGDGWRYNCANRFADKAHEFTGEDRLGDCLVIRTVQDRLY